MPSTNSVARRKKAGQVKQKRRCEPPAAPRSRRKLLSAPDARPSSALQPQAAAPGELTEAQAKHAALALEVMGMATGVGDNNQVAWRLLSQFQSMLFAKADPTTTLMMLIELKPKNILETLLVTQMMGTHEASLAFLRASTAEDQGEFRDQHASRATRFMRLFMEQMEQLQRMRGNTRQQKVVVEHVTVNAGGQAIVGAVGSRGEGGKTEK